jgi:uncharacterized protein YbjT (DUF2867 family)
VLPVSKVAPPPWRYCPEGIKSGLSHETLPHRPLTDCVSRGVEIAVGDFTDHDSLVRAIRGADAVYAMSTPYEQGSEKEIAQGMTITDAAKAAGVAHFIYSSVASANRATGIAHFDGKYAVEKHLQASGVPYTIVAPVFFMENLLQPWTLSGLRQGKLGMALPASRSLQQISVADIGAFVR